MLRATEDQWEWTQTLIMSHMLTVRCGVVNIQKQLLQMMIFKREPVGVEKEK